MFGSKGKIFLDTDDSQDNSKIKRRFHRPVLIYLKKPQAQSHAWVFVVAVLIHTYRHLRHALDTLNDG